eukprot:CAMPEP_0118889696 /NCGR_PEP_ID=MMETSP1166-20130328/498_1 /TAXON_ID=1104430 /ORGANISM="Chrysoreinhardia sp, Strain CCMP3193" /LENGTH=169 /DNA_ID=CAMNT_0006828289 /DNA_START=571 /DNA_END=1077 /DNA_ORIENTATION=+
MNGTARRGGRTTRKRNASSFSNVASSGVLRLDWCRLGSADKEIVAIEAGHHSGKNLGRESVAGGPRTNERTNERSERTNVSNERRRSRGERPSRRGEARTSAPSLHQNPLDQSIDRKATDVTPREVCPVAKASARDIDEVGNVLSRARSIATEGSLFPTAPPLFLAARA